MDVGRNPPKTQTTPRAPGRATFKAMQLWQSLSIAGHGSQHPCTMLPGLSSLPQHMGPHGAPTSIGSMVWSLNARSPGHSPTPSPAPQDKGPKAHLRGTSTQSSSQGHSQAPAPGAATWVQLGCGFPILNAPFPKCNGNAANSPLKFLTVQKQLFS